MIRCPTLAAFLFLRLGWETMNPPRSVRKKDSQLRAGNLGLYACGEVLHCQNTGFELILAKNHDVAGGFVGSFKGFFQAEAALA